MFALQRVQAKNKETPKLRIIGPLWDETNGDRWITFTED